VVTKDSMVGTSDIVGDVRAGRATVDVVATVDVEELIEGGEVTTAGLGASDTVA
jgi:hypothetical protein